MSFGTLYHCSIFSRPVTALESPRPVWLLTFFEDDFFSPCLDFLRNCSFILEVNRAPPPCCPSPLLSVLCPFDLRSHLRGRCSRTTSLLSFRSIFLFQECHLLSDIILNIPCLCHMLFKIFVPLCLLLSSYTFRPLFLRAGRAKLGFCSITTSESLQVLCVLMMPGLCTYLFPLPAVLRLWIVMGLLHSDLY